MAFMKQLVLGRDVRDPIISVVIDNTVVTPGETGRKHLLTGGQLTLLAKCLHSETDTAGIGLRDRKSLSLKNQCPSGTGLICPLCIVMSDEFPKCFTFCLLREKSREEMTREHIFTNPPLCATVK